MQAVAVNQRRERFQDARVRQALGLCFDFEWTRRNLFYGSYERSQSCFETSDYKAEGLPSPAELALLEPLRDKLPPEAFGEAVTQAVTDGSGRDRKILGQASKLLADAGWTRNGAFLVDAKGEKLTAEILVEDETFVRIFSPWIENMKAIGIDASIRMVDATQYQARQADFDFDLISMALSFTATPTRDDMESIFHSKSAGLVGSRNLPGIADPAIDALVDAVGTRPGPRKPDHRHARARPGLARAAGLDSKLVLGDSPGRLLGHVRLQGAEARLRLPGRGHVVVRRGKGEGDWEGLRFQGMAGAE